MTTKDYIKSNEAYLGRLKQMRQREKERLSDVDFALFVKRFNRLIAKVESELNFAKTVGELYSNCVLIPCATTCNGSVFLGPYTNVSDFSIVLTHYGCESVSSIREPQLYPTQVSVNTVSVRNDATVMKDHSYVQCLVPA